MSQTSIRRTKSLCLSLDFHVTEADDDDYLETDSQMSKRRLRKGPDSRRWLVLFLYGAAAVMQVMIWNTWSPITNSALFAFQTWRPATIALLNNWGCITFLICIVPASWFLNNQGLRVSFVCAVSLSAVGSGLRLINMEERTYTNLVHAGAIFNAMGGVALSPAILLLSSTWFPPHERVTATGIGTTMSMLGIACSYVLGPAVVSEPPKTETIDSPALLQRKIVQNQILNLCAFDFAAEVCLVLLILVFFPSGPRLPASRSTILKESQETEGLGTSIKDLAGKYNFWILALSASMCSGVTGPWLSLLPIVLSNTNITQAETANIGFWTIILSCVLSISASKLTDYCPRKIRYLLIGIIFIANIMFVWILLITTKRVPFNKNYLAMAVVLGLALVWAAPPLFYEFGAEVTYPIPEGIIAGFMMAMNNAVACCIYLVLLMVPDMDVSWMNYALAMFGMGSLLLLFFVKDEHNRLDIDLPGLLDQ